MTQGNDAPSTPVSQSLFQWLLSSPLSIVALVTVLLLSGVSTLVVLRGPETFTLIVLPDTQYYIESYPNILDEQIQWILDQKTARNILYVAHEGDIVEHWDQPQEWELAETLFGRLDGIVPYALLPGNHDMSPSRDTEDFNRAFPASQFAEQSGWIAGYPPGNNDNSAYQFSAGGYDFSLFRIGADDFLLLNLEFCPTMDVLTWAKEILEAYRDHFVILVTHGYLNIEAQRHVNQASGGCIDSLENTRYIWDELVAPFPQVFLVLSGHEYNPEYGYGEAFRVDRNQAGHLTYQMLADFQARVRGGDGWLRILGFNQQERILRVRTYSTHHMRYERDEDSDYILPYPERARLR